MKGSTSDKNKIAIIGGGPSGSFSAHFLNKFARQAGKKISIDLYDYKTFSCVGRPGCNMCAGIISYSLAKKLEEERIILPPTVIKSEITGYQLHSRYNKVYFLKEGSKKIYSVFRGRGPATPDPESQSFDQFLLDFIAREKNVRVIGKKVIDLELNPHQVTLKTEDDSLVEYDFVVGAFGVNTKIKEIIKSGYTSPRTVHFFQFEIQLSEDFVHRTYQGRVQMFPVYKKNIWFINLTPKWDIVTITVVGKNVQPEDIKRELLRNPAIRYYLPGKEMNLLCKCSPQFPVGFAKKPYHDRFIIVGDACVSRYLKNGIESAYKTAFFAADSIINHPWNRREIKKWYHKRCCREYRLDNRCGKVLYLLNRMLYKTPILTEAQMAAARKEQVTKTSSRFSDVFWDMFTGDKGYKKILKNALHPYIIFNSIKHFFVLLAKMLVKGKPVLNLSLSKLHKLLNYHTVAIIGGGPAGCACALKLQQLAEEKNLELRIVLYEGKDFRRHHNQCVGILSPPILETLQEELKITIPPELIKSTVPGYELHTDKEAIFLQNYRMNEGNTYSVRRSELDDFLLKKVSERGIQVVNSRVTDLEFHKDLFHDEVRIFSESNFVKADVVVGAFGLDGEMLEKFSEATGKRYRKPRKIMKTYITRFDFSREFLNNLYDRRIYPFLISSVKHISFGAITIKDAHIVVNVAGEKVQSKSLLQFLQLDKVGKILPSASFDRINFFSGRFPSSPAKGPYGHRYVTIGDATGWLRPLKGKGINLAVITGISAAKVMINKGVSRKDFKHYFRLCREFRQDYKYGIFIRISLKIINKLGLLDVMIRRAKKRPRFYNMLYDSVSAERSYRNILINFFKKIKKTDTEVPE